MVKSLSISDFFILSNKGKNMFEKLITLHIIFYTIHSRLNDLS
jgi:hypothetical protein